MRGFWVVYVVLLLLVAAGAVLAPTLNLGWVLLALIVVGLAVLVGWFIRRGGAPDDKFPWE
jgi:hypothetical protein